VKPCGHKPETTIRRPDRAQWCSQTDARFFIAHTTRDAEPWADRMSASPAIAVIARRGRHVRLVPNSEVVRFGVATLIHDVVASLQSHIDRPENSPQLIPTQI
jgi:hypothetical protein